MARPDEEKEEVVSPMARLFMERLRDDDQDLVIHVLLTLGQPTEGDGERLDVASLHRLLRENVLSSPRFSSLLVRKRRRIGPLQLEDSAAWVPVAVDLDDHVIEVDIPPPLHPLAGEGGGGGGDESCSPGHAAAAAASTARDLVLRYVETQCAVPLRRDIPLWQIQILSHPPVCISQGGSGSQRVSTQTLLWRLHHALGDGLALGTILGKGARTAAGRPPKNWIQIPEKLTRKRSLLQAAVWVFQYLVNSLLVFWKLNLLLLLPGDPVVGVKSPSPDIRHKPRELSRFGVPLEDVRRVAASCGATVNDVLLLLLSAAIHWSIPREEKDKLHRLPRALCMASLRSLSGLMVAGKMPDSLADLTVPMGTKVGFFAVDLPTVVKGSSDVPGARERAAFKVALAKLKSDTATIKHSFEAWFMNFFLRLTSWTLGPLSMYRLVLLVIEKVTTAVSTLPGPSEDLFLCGSPLLSVHQFLAGAPIGVSLHCVTCAGVVHCTITADPAIVHADAFRDRMLEAWNFAQ